MSFDKYSPTCKLVEGLSIQKLLSGEQDEIILDEDTEFVGEGSCSVDNVYDFEEYIDRVNLDCVKCDPEDVLPTETPFAALAKAMTNVTPDGKVKKKMITPGKDPIPMGAIVYVHYDFYLEMNEIPIDSTYMRRGKPERLQIGNNQQIAGFDIAVNSMSVGEKSQFLIHHDYAFRAMGCPPRIPREATIMAIIEVLEIVASGLIDQEEALSFEDSKCFAAVRPRAVAQHNMANSYFKRKRLGGAVEHYLAEEKLLLPCSGGNEAEEKERKQMLLKLYVNLAVCYNHPQLKNPEKALFNVKKGFEIDQPSALRNAKLFFARGVAQMAKCEYKLALENFKKAQFIEPNNKEVWEKIFSVEEKITQAEKMEKDIAVRALSGLDLKEKKSSDNAEGSSNPPSEEKSPPVSQISDTRGSPLSDENEANYDVAESAKENNCMLEHKELLEMGKFSETAKILEDFAKSKSSSLTLGRSYRPAERLWLKRTCEQLGLIYEEQRVKPLQRRICIRKNTK